MKITNTIAFLVLCLSFSCKKEIDKVEENVTFPLTLHLQNLVKKTEIRLYTVDGEIKDQATINQFIEKEKNYFITPDKFSPDDSKITFLSKDTVIFNGNDKLKYSVVREGDLSLFYSANIIRNNEALIDQIFKYQAKKTPVPSWPNNYITQEVRVARGNYDKFLLSNTAYKLKQTSSHPTYGVSAQQWSGIIFNEIADNITTKLGKQGTQDTLAVLESSLVFSR